LKRRHHYGDMLFDTLFPLSHTRRVALEEVTGGRSLLTVAVIGKAALRISQQAYKPRGSCL
ncbi:MAG: hypothetical protein ABJ319_14420, partial [Alloalcanivorax venustensis]|uniref:hypothetical protein n=1 Tax=Alloalcanivorax venustensis TaxID=172371 RepID=UPI003298F3F3